jgi:hypothetical protein
VKQLKAKTLAIDLLKPPPPPAATKNVGLVDFRALNDAKAKKKAKAALSGAAATGAVQQGAGLVFRPEFALEDAIGSLTCSLAMNSVRHR